MERPVLLPVVLPEGLVLHCGGCGVVVPSDAPRPEGGDCALVAANKLSHFRANETIKGQHTMATAAWSLIYHDLLHGPNPDAAIVAYWHQYRSNPKQHFVSSAARQALTSEQVAEQISMKPPDIRVGKDVLRAASVRRDANFYDD
jgi:hypothetical protein